MGLDVESEAMHSQYSRIAKHMRHQLRQEMNLAFLSLVKTIVQSGAVEQVQRGRYMAAISLREAETLRGIIHMFPKKAIVEQALHSPRVNTQWQRRAF